MGELPGPGLVSLMLKRHLASLAHFLQCLDWGFCAHAHPKLMTYLLPFRYAFSTEQDATLFSVGEDASEKGSGAFYKGATGIIARSQFFVLGAVE